MTRVTNWNGVILQSCVLLIYFRESSHSLKNASGCTMVRQITQTELWAVCRIWLNQFWIQVLNHLLGHRKCALSSSSCRRFIQMLITSTLASPQKATPNLWFLAHAQTISTSLCYPIGRLITMTLSESCVRALSPNMSHSTWELGLT